MASKLLLAIILSNQNSMAKTVALWKLDYEVFNSAVNTRCLVNPANDLETFGSLWRGEAVDTWSTLPPNPDTTAHLLDVTVNNSSIGLYTGRNGMHNSGHASGLVDITRSFTIEGWIYRSVNPSGNEWHYIVGNHLTGSGRWILSLRNGGTKWILYVGNQINDVAFALENDPADINTWRHIALTYDREAGNSQQGVWELFVDSVSHGAITNASRLETITTSDSIFCLGGRSDANNTFSSKLDYWRISDHALAVNEFLNAGIPAPPEPETLPRTIAYWRLDGRDDNTHDVNDSVGVAHLGPGRQGEDTHNTPLQGSMEAAFAGQPPNSSITIPNGNTSSIYAQNIGACLQVPDLGTYLETTNSFTVEGWLCPRRRNYVADIQYIANTRISSKGWAFAIKRSASLWRFVIYAEDDAGTLATDTPLSGDLADWGDTWKHVALVYNADAGDIAQGVWSCYLDGELTGSVTNSHARSGTTDSSYFHLAGRLNNGYTFCGLLDCWRVSQTALAPNQFLNATEGAAPATDVLAFWPLESEDGIYIDGRDLVGNWSFNTPLAQKYRVALDPAGAGATVPNPDDTDTFRGDPALNAGAITFNTPANQAQNAYLVTTDATLRQTLCLTNSFTWEAWCYRTQNPGAWQLIFGTANALDFSSAEMRINLSYRANGYILYIRDKEKIMLNDASFGYSDAINEWHHLALVYDAENGNGTWTLYVDGVVRGSPLENTVAPEYLLPGAVYIGGRPSSANSFNGRIDSMRLTKGVLTPAQFLNYASSENPQPAAPCTMAYWKLDNNNGLLDTSSQVEPRFSFPLDAFTPGGSEAQFKRYVPLPDESPAFIGNPRDNNGSVAFGGTSYLRVQNLGVRLEPDRPFTVEGWMLWDAPATDASQVLCGTRFGANAVNGWLLTLVTSNGTSSFRLTCRTLHQTPLVEALFTCDASTLEGAWHHLALTFEPKRADTGAWELFIDGKSVGTVANRFYPTEKVASHWFTLGGQSNGTNGFTGMLDCWRVSAGALRPDQFLYLGYDKGTLLLMQ